MTSPHQSQNPYLSVLVQASAGSGKTYQLSRRFFALVMAGATPNSICCITFTKATAADMRQKILRLASDVMTSTELQQHFAQQAKDFFVSAASTHALPPPISPREAAEKILQSSQMLRIGTIDSLFYDWLRKFPYEAAGDNRHVPESFNLAIDNELAPLREQSAQQALLQSCQIAADNSWLRDLQKQSGPRGLIRAFLRLQAHSSLLWLLQQNGAGISNLPLTDELRHLAEQNDGEFLITIAPLARMIGERSGAKTKENILKALASGELSEVLACRLFRKEDFAVSGVISAKHRAGIEQEILQLENLVRQHLNAKAIIALNQAAEFFSTAQTTFQRLYQDRKRANGYIEFDDLNRGAFHLFHDPESAGAAYMIQRGIQHLLLDEFQDTNRIQWSIFHHLANELLAGEGGNTDTALPPTVFIVGDSKQSIYGFREADPTILDEAYTALAPLGLQKIAMNASYRSAPLLFTFLNQWFSGVMAEYPEHQTASDPSTGQPVIPDHARLIIADAFNDDNVSLYADENDTDSNQIEREAKFVAAALKQILVNEPQRYPVWDGRQLRPIRADDCAILYRNGTHAAVYENALRNVGLAAARSEARGFLHRTEINDCLNLLQYLALPDDLLSLCTVLRSPWLGVSDSILIDVLAATQDQAATTNRTAQVLAALPETCAPAREHLQRLRARTAQLPPHRLLLEAITAFAAKERYLRHLGAIEGELAAANLDTLVELCQQIEKNHKSHLLQVLQHLQTLKDDDTIGSTTIHRHCITLLTVHKAKGLEFPLVVLADTSAPWARLDEPWARLSQGAAAGLYFVGKKKERPLQEPHFNALLTAIETEQQAEAARLLYVAITRAKQYLLVTGTAARAKSTSATADANYLDMIQDAARAAGAREELIAGHRCLTITTENAPSVTTRDVGNTTTAAAPISDWQPVAVTDNHFPSEVLTVRPHAGDRTFMSEQTKTTVASDGRNARIYGIVLHSVLESYVANQRPPAAARLSALAAREDIDNILRPKDYVAYATAALAEAAALVDTPAWAALFTDAQHTAAEVPITYLHQQELLTGQIDLLIRYHDGSVRVVDYKTTADAEHLRQAEDAQLRDWALQAGYQQQLQAYTDMVAATYTDAVRPPALHGAVFFTKIQRWIDLS